MTFPSSGYRAVCRLCQTVIVSSLPHGRFENYEQAAKVVHAHLLHRCELANNNMKTRDRELIANRSIEVIEGAA